MHLTFRLKLFIITGVASLGFVVLIVTGLVITNRVNQQLERIQEQYIPLVELRPQLEANLEQLARAFQDAVATQDLEALGNASAVKADFLKKLADAEAAIDAATSDSLRHALEEYYVAAHDVSLRLIREDTGLSAVDAMLDMQSKQAHVLAVLQQSTIFNKDTLEGAFRQIEGAMLTAANLRSGIAIVCLLAVILLSMGITRQMVRSLTQVRTGLWRFGQGNFTQPIETAPDEFGDVAGSANLMARRIQELLLERERKSEELEKANIMLAVTNKELEAFSYSVSHDLRAPLRAIDGFSQALLKDYGEKFDAQGHHYLERVRAATVRMSRLIEICSTYPGSAGHRFATRISA